MPSRDRVGGGGGEDDVVAHSYHGCAVGLFGQFSGFKRQLLPAGEVDGDGADFWFHIHPLIFWIRSAVALSG